VIVQLVLKKLKMKGEHVIHEDGQFGTAQLTTYTWRKKSGSVLRTSSFFRYLLCAALARLTRGQPRRKEVLVCSRQLYLLTF
jgi:hypothetical protein